jgi:hypothetical protein
MSRVIFDDNLVEFFSQFRRDHPEIRITPPHGAIMTWEVSFPDEPAQAHPTGAAVREALEERFPPVGLSEWITRFKQDHPGIVIAPPPVSKSGKWDVAFPDETEQTYGSGSRMRADLRDRYPEN